VGNLLRGAQLDTAAEIRPVDSLSSTRSGGEGRGEEALHPGGAAPLPHPLPARASLGEGGTRGQCPDTPLIRGRVTMAFELLAASGKLADR
jgi:hypothetical protein